MKMPHRENAYVPPAKLTAYLLNERHKDGGSKARLLRLFGYTQDNVETLRQILVDVAQTCEVSEVVPAADGVKFVFDEDIPTPIGRTLRLRMIWKIDEEPTRPRFISAYPLKPNEV